MRSKKFILGFAMLGLVVASCGGSNKGSDATAAKDTSATDSGDRERNVEMSTGWGDDGSGFARLVINDANELWSQPEVFVRVDKTPSGSTNAMFAATVVNTTQKDESSSKLVVHGFQRNASTKKPEALAGFGSNGAVTIDLPSGDEVVNWTPRAWTVISRKYVALLFDIMDAEGNPDAMIRFYDLSTGRLAPELGTKGEIRLVQSDIGLQWIQDLALRRVDTDGTIHLVVMGGSWGTDGEGSIGVYGFTADGKPDPAVGGADGHVNLAPYINDQLANSAGVVRLADPGIDPKSEGSIALVTPLDFPMPSEDQSGETTVMRGLGALVLSVPSGGKPIGTDPKSVATSWGNVYADELTVESAVVDGTGVRAVATVGWSGEAGQVVDVAIAPGNETPTDMIPQPTFVSKGTSGQRSQHVQSVTTANQGDWYGVDVVDDGEARAQTLQICFVRDNCSDANNKVSRVLSPLPKGYGKYYSPSTVRIDATGLHTVLTESSSLENTTELSLVSFDTAGLPAPSRVKLDSVFGTDTYSQSNELTSSVGWPVPLDGQSVVALEQNDNQTPQMNLRRQAGTGTSSRTGLVPPSSLNGFVADTGGLVVIDATHVGVRAVHATADGDEQVLVSIDTTTGSVDPNFGSGGFLPVPMPDEEFVAGSPCLERRFIWSKSGLTILDLLWGVDDSGDCNGKMSKVSWQRISPAGVVTPASIAVIDNIDDEYLTSLTVDATGNLYVGSIGSRFVDATFTDVDAETGESTEVPYQRRIAFVKIRRYSAAGSLDVAFGQAGIVEFNADSAPQFAGINDVTVVVDDGGRIYAAGMNSSDGDVLVVARLTSTGAIDLRSKVSNSPTSSVVPDETTTTTTAPPTVDDLAGGASSATPAPKTFQERIDDIKRRADEFAAKLPLITPETADAALAEIKSIQADLNALLVEWIPKSVGVQILATALPSGKSCVSTDGKCTIKGLDPSQAYTVVLSKVGDPVPAADTATVPAVKPMVLLKVGKSANTKSLVKPASKGKATWRVTGGCRLNASFTKVSAPKTPTTCQLSVTTAKDAKTPMTTKSVTISVTK